MSTSRSDAPRRNAPRATLRVAGQDAERPGGRGHAEHGNKIWMRQAEQDLASARDNLAVQRFHNAVSEHAVPPKPKDPRTRQT